MTAAAVVLLWLFMPPAVAAEPGGLEVIADPGIRVELDGRDAIFYAIDLEHGRRHAWAPERADERHIPYSTFKVPNLLIALETGVASSIDDVRQRDPERRPAQTWWSEAWREDQTLAQAFRRSTVWYFQDVALEVGGPRYREMLRAFGYGNAMAPDDNDAGWLVGWVERPDGAPVAYALYVRGPSFDSISTFRGEMARSFLRHIGAWPGDS